jgi:hypothetical protein
MAIPGETTAVGDRLSASFGLKSSADASSLWRLALVVAQLGLVMLVVWRYQLESRTFFNVLALGCAGFCVHALLPLRFRLGMFVALSLAGIALAFGVADGVWLVLLGQMAYGSSCWGSC